MSLTPGLYRPGITLTLGVVKVVRTAQFAALVHEVLEKHRDLALKSSCLYFISSGTVGGDRFK